MSDLSRHPEAHAAAPVAPRLPRIAIMGEFSAGKSTLSNLLLGARPLPEKVTATRLSPVWLRHGTADPMAVGTDGYEMPIDAAEIESLDVDATRYVAMRLESEILRHCDLIDFPGISDPNMDPAVWERMLPEVDMVLWCTHATQAWRQSEAAAWGLVPAAVRARSMLLVTRFDKLVTERDRARVLARLRAETEGLFRGIYPLALLQALQATATGDHAAWEASGAPAFAGDLQGVLMDPATAAWRATGDAPEAGAPSDAPETAPAAAETEAEAEDGARVLPRRVRASGRSPRPRPAA